MNEDETYTVTEKIIKQVVEDEEKFVFDTISPWFNDNARIIVPKELLIMALECFKREHKDEFVALMNRYLPRGENTETSNGDV